MKPQYQVNWCNLIDGADDDWLPYTYTAIHLPTQEVFEKTVYCDKRVTFLELLNQWNHNNSPDLFTWKYYA